MACESKSVTSNKRATETISKTYGKYMNNILGKHEIKELQKISILGAAHILREVPV